MDATPGEIELAMADIVAIPISRPCAHVSGALEEKRMGQTPTRLGTCLFFSFGATKSVPHQEVFHTLSAIASRIAVGVHS